MTTFADLSHHQGGIDLTAYAKTHDRIAFKATQGGSYTDPTFTARWRQAGTLGLARIAYHYAENDGDGAKDFDRLYALVSLHGLSARDVLCLDQEDTATPQRAAAYTGQWTERAASRGVAGIIYTGAWYANPNGVTAAVAAPPWRRLWLSDYSATHSDTAMPLPTGWTRGQVVARQYTDKATVAGITGTCDYSRVLQDWLSGEDDDMTALFANVAEFQAAVRAAADESQREVATRVLLRGLTGQANQAFTVDGWTAPSVAGQLAPIARAATTTAAKVADVAAAVTALQTAVAGLAESQRRVEAALSAAVPQTAPVAGDVAVTGTLHLGE